MLKQNPETLIDLERELHLSRVRFKVLYRHSRENQRKLDLILSMLEEQKPVKKEAQRIYMFKGESL